MKISEIPHKRLAELNKGLVATTNLTEWLAVDQRQLLESLKLTEIRAALPELSVPRQIAWIGSEVAKIKERAHLEKHASDIVRCWACYASVSGKDLKGALKAVKPFAEDPHFGIREVAWMSVREKICEQPLDAVALLQPWSKSEHEYIRRFASEATRPRGVWAKHISHFKKDPAPALPLLEPLISDSSKYVRDSVGNWLNDAAKDNPDWVLKVTRVWSKKSSTPETKYIVKRSRRSI